MFKLFFKSTVRPSGMVWLLDLRTRCLILGVDTRAAVLLLPFRASREPGSLPTAFRNAFHLELGVLLYSLEKRLDKSSDFIHSFIRD